MYSKRVFPIHPNRHQVHFIVDLIAIAISVYIAVLFARSGIVLKIASLGPNFLPLEIFLSGMFFTSIFTTAPAVAALAQLAHSAAPIHTVVIFGALGAVFGDVILFKLMKDRIYEDVMFILGDRKGIRSLFRAKLFRWLSFLIGGLFIASPVFPDELGIAMMGLSKAGLAAFIPVSATFNTLGVLLISLGGKFIH
jgi:hypothetical protein